MFFLCERQGFGEGDAAVFVLHSQLDGFIGDRDVCYMSIACVKAMRVVVWGGLGGGGVPLVSELAVEAEFVDNPSAAVLKVFGLDEPVGLMRSFFSPGFMEVAVPQCSAQ